MFWKKKNKQEEPAPQAQDKPVTYNCDCINYTRIHEIEGEDMEPIKEELFEKLQSLNKVYTRADIDKMSDMIGYNIWEAFHWIPTDDYKGMRRRIDIVYRWEGAKPGLLEEEYINKQKEHIKEKEFYKRSDIEKMSMKLGYSVWDRNEWMTFRMTTITYADGRDETTYTKQVSPGKQ